MQPTAGDPELLNHFTVAVYPFLHDLTPPNRGGRLKALQGRWAPWWARLTDREAAAAVESTSFFLPYVRGLLAPETVLLHDEPPGEQYGRWVDCLRGWSDPGLAAYTRELPPHAVLRLTAVPLLHAPLLDFTLVQRRESAGRVVHHLEIPATIDWIDALVFPTGLGFLLLKVRLREPRPTLSRLIALNAAVRLVHPPTLSWTLPVLRIEEGGAEIQVRDLMNHLTAGLTGPLERDEPPDGPLTPIRLGAEDGAYTDGDAGRCYGERCQLLSYACVHLGDEGRRELPAGAFAEGEDRVLFEYAACIGLGESVRNPLWAPAPELAQRVTRENRLAMWRTWKAMVLKESCVFLALDDLNFNRKSLPHNIEHDYLSLYLYTLYQKFQLVAFSTELMREVGHASGRLSGARALLRRFVAFRSQYWFSEVTRKPIGSELYRILHYGLEVPALYHLVTGSVKEAQEYYEGIWARKVQWAKDALTYGGPVMVALGAARVFLAGADGRWTVAVTAAVVVAVVAALILRWRGSGGRRPAKGRPRRKDVRRRPPVPARGREVERDIRARSVSKG